MNGATFGSIEMQMLWLSIVLGLVQLVLATLFSVGKRGLPWGVGPRDEPAPPMGKFGGRIERAFKNFLETFVFFLGAVLIAQALNKHTASSALGAQIYSGRGWSTCRSTPSASRSCAPCSGSPAWSASAWSCAASGRGCEPIAPLRVVLKTMAKRAKPADDEPDLFGSPPKPSLAALRQEAAHCTRCDLYRPATQTVFGEGPAEAKIVPRRRAAGRRRGPGRQALRRAGRQAARRRAGRGGDRARQGLCHQCGEAFQIRAARQAAHPFQAECRRDQGVPMVAGAGVRRAVAEDRGRAGRHGGAGASRPTPSR